MSKINLRIDIDAPPELVFEIISDLDGSRAKAAGIDKVEIITPGPIGVGTKWRETHVMNNRETVEEMEVTAYEPPHLLSAYSDSQGFDVAWAMQVKSTDAGCILHLDMTSTSRTFASKFKAPIAWLMTGMMKKMVAKDLENMKQFIEAQATTAIHD